MGIVIRQISMHIGPTSKILLNNEDVVNFRYPYISHRPLVGLIEDTSRVPGLALVYQYLQACNQRIISELR